MRAFDLVPIRYGRMMASPLAFFRGSAAIMGYDLARTPSSGITVQLCGDAHVGNFGGFTPAGRSVVFDINDFDETLPGPWEWDVKRLAASLEVAARESAIPPAERLKVVRAAPEAYRSAMREFASSRYLDVLHRQFDAHTMGNISSHGRSGKRRERVDSAQDRRKDNERAIEKRTRRVDGKIRLVDVPPLVETLRSLMPADEAALIAGVARENLERYRMGLSDDRRRVLDHYEVRDFARKVVGVGSVGMRTYLVLMTSRDGDDDALVLQLKEASRSVLEPFAGKSAYEQGGRRVVEGQRLMQASSDVLLGWARGPDADGIMRDFYVRQLWDWKVGPDVERANAGALRVLAQACGWTLARAHALTGDRIALAHYLGSDRRFANAIAGFADSYADQNQSDYETLLSAVDRGRIVVRTGV